MNVQTSIYPNAGDEPTGSINPGPAGGHPFAVLYFETGRSGPWVALSLLSDDDAVAYLDHLADLASGLATKIRLAQTTTTNVRACSCPAGMKHHALNCPQHADEATRIARETSPPRPGGAGFYEAPTLGCEH